MAVAGFKIKTNGGAFTDEIIDIGFPTPVSGFVEYVKTMLEADTDYQFEAAAYDGRGNLAAWGTPYVYTTPAVSAAWETITNPHWTLNVDNSIDGNTDGSEDFVAVAVPRLTTIGDYIEFSFENSNDSGFDALFHYRMTDEAAHHLFTYVSGQINDESGSLGGFQAYAAHDTYRITKTSASRISISVNGASATEIPKDLTGDLTLQVETASYIGLTINAFTTNIVF